MEGTPNMPEVQQMIHDHVRANIASIKNRDPGAAEKAVDYAYVVTRNGLLACGVSAVIAEAKHKAIADSILQWELFNALMGDY